MNGTVVDAQGRPIEGAGVFIEPAHLETVTNARGGFRWALPPGQYVVQARKGGAASEPVIVTVVSGAPTVVEIRLAIARAQGAITGTVMDAEGRPVEAATVVLEPSRREALTDSQGSFRFEGLLGSTHHVLRATKGKATSEPVSVSIVSRAPYVVELRLPAEKVASGTKETADEHVSPLVVMIRGKLGDAGEVLGAGIIVGQGNGRLYIATADHVLRRGNDTMQDLTIAFKWLPGETTKGDVAPDHDSRLDLAIVIVRDGPDLPAEAAFDIVGATPVRKDSVFTIGHPNGQPWFMGAAPDTVADTVGDTIQFQSVFLAPGNSGGALVNAKSELIGLVTQDDPPLGRALKIESALERVRRWRYPVALTGVK